MQLASLSDSSADQAEHEGRNPKLAIRIAVGCLAIISLINVAYLAAAKTTWGRGHLAEAIERELGARLPGSVDIGRLTKVTPSRLEVTGLTFREPEGGPVLELDRVNLRVDLGALVSGRIAIATAETRSGTLRIEEQADGSVLLEDAFSDEGGRSDLDLSIREIRVNDLTVLIKLAGTEPLRISGLNALMRIEKRPGKGVDVRFDQATGKLVEGLPVGELELRKLSGRVRGKVEHVLAVDGHVQLIDDAFEIHLDYYDRETTPVKLRLTGLDLSLTALGALGLDASSEFLSGVDLELGAANDSAD